MHPAFFHVRFLAKYGLDVDLVFGVHERLVKEGFFEKLFGPEIKAEEERKAKFAFR